MNVWQFLKHLAKCIRWHMTSRSFEGYWRSVQGHLMLEKGSKWLKCTIYTILASNMNVWQFLKHDLARRIRRRCRIWHQCHLNISKEETANVLKIVNHLWSWIWPEGPLKVSKCHLRLKNRSDWQYINTIY